MAMLQLNKAATLARMRRARSQLTPFGVDSPLPKKVRSYFYLGLLLTAAFVAQSLVAWHWPWLSDLQENESYKQLSGLALLTFIAHQWHFSVLRARGLQRKAGGLSHRHKWIGALAPLFFYLHSQQLGYGYQQLLSLAFFGIFLSGLCNPEITRVHLAWFKPAWITVHVGLSVVLLSLAGYHIYIGFAYQ